MSFNAYQYYRIARYKRVRAAYKGQAKVPAGELWSVHHEKGADRAWVGSQAP